MLLSYCLRCRKNTESKNPKIIKIKNGRIMLLSKCAVCDSKKSISVKEQKAIGLVNNLGIKTPLSKKAKTPLSRSSFVLIVLNKLIQGIRFACR